jgi:hypothetical protein
MYIWPSSPAESLPKVTGKWSHMTPYQQHFMCTTYLISSIFSVPA